MGPLVYPQAVQMASIAPSRLLKKASEGLASEGLASEGLASEGPTDMSLHTAVNIDGFDGSKAR